MKKEDFFEVLGEIDENFVEGAKRPMKNKFNWKTLSAVAACFALAAAIGTGILNNNADDKNGVSTMKPVINFEGIVQSVEDGKVTLNDGKVVIITDETEFAGDLDTTNEVSEEILIGNFIQGYTRDNADATEITADKIWTNERRSAVGGKRVVNFEGRVTEVLQGSIVLDSGKVVVITGETIVTSPNGDSVEIVVGDYIQGYAENAENSEISAKNILVTTL